MNPEPLGPWTEADAAAIVREVAENTRRKPRRSRRHSGWRARIAGWLRRWADRINPLEVDRG